MDFIYQLDYFYLIILVVFLFVAIIQLVYYLFIYIRPLLRKEEKKTGADIETPPVSVIICARNEQENLSQNLVSVLTQDYPSYEVIVVNDCSEDDTEMLLEQLKREYPRLRSTIIKKDASFVNGKKFAATLGVKAAQNEWLLFTDADCKPAGPQWVRSMSKYFIDKKSIVLGYGGYTSEKGLLNRWIKYDTCFIALQYFGFAMAGMPYMGVGRNMAYRKSLFYAHNGFAAHAHILSGDDDLFVNQAATKRNVAVNLSPESYTYSVPKKTFREWVWQKSRHISTSKYYPPKHSFFLGLELFSRVLFWGVFAVLMFHPLLWQYVLAIFLLRMIIFLIIFGIATRKFNIKGIMPFTVFFDLAMPFVYIYVFLLNRISSKQNKWK